MHITNFQAQNYRNVATASINFCPGVNLLWGDNAQGKTNLLEGIYTFARGKSFRGASDSELCRFGTDGYSLSLTCHTGGRAVTLGYRYAGGTRERRLGGAPVSRLSEMIGHFRAVLFYPDHLQLVKGGPGERRLFLNIAISQLDPLYLASLSRFEKLLANRNALLKDAQKLGFLDRDLLAAYSEGMAAECATIAAVRERYISSLERESEALLHALSSGRERLTLRYTGGGTKEDYEKKLTSSLDREIAAGCSLFGVHRDEMDILLNDIDARAYASQGQKRSLVLSLKLGEGEVARARSGEYPVFLFDDVLSELDEGRRAFILSDAGERQVIMTSCERRGFEGVAANEICVRDGVYE